MHNGILKIALALTFWLALHTSSLKAQLLGPYGSSPTTFEVDANGLLSSTGTYGTGSLSISGAGTRMLWYPGKGAFRAGAVDGTQWNDGNIGEYSVGLGYDAAAYGPYNIAIGYETSSSATASTAIGYWATATQNEAMALGSGTATNYYSLATGMGTSTGYLSTAMGFSTAVGDLSTALGNFSYASGEGSLSTGDHTYAYGTDTTSAGYETMAQAEFSFAIGTYNLSGGSETTWVAGDPLFEIGNGTSSARSDAFIVYKSGDAILQGTLQTAPGGDIPMFTGY